MSETVWRVRYVNEGELAPRVVDITTDTNSVADLAAELEQFEGSRILSIKNETLDDEEDDDDLDDEDDEEIEYSNDVADHAEE